MLKRLVREPLIHFFGLALLIFGAYGLLNGHGLSAKPQIEVTPARIEQIVGLFTKSWQRPPTPEELKGLIDDYVKEEIYYREAMALGLDTDDTVIRRRMRLKMEMLNESAADELSPSDADLKAYLEAHPDAYRVEPSVAFEQVYLSTDKHGTAIDADAAALLQKLRAGAFADPRSAGDAGMLPYAEPTTARSGIARDFGEAFAAAVVDLPVGQWSGPIKSSFGLHLVKVAEKNAGRLPDLADVRDAVLRDWRIDEAKIIDAKRLSEFAGHYNIVISAPNANGAMAAGTQP